MIENTLDIGKESYIKMEQQDKPYLTKVELKPAKYSCSTCGSYK